MLRESAFHFLRFFKGLVHLMLNILMIVGALLVFGLTLSLIFTHANKAFLPMLISDIVAGVVWIGCFILKFKYDVLILKLQPKDMNMTLYQ
jgi:hypothetical protein